MPSLAKHNCSEFGCSQLVTAGSARCSKHTRPRVEVARPKTAERGYDADFRALRPFCFERDHWRCVDCGWQPESVRICQSAGLEMPPTDKLLKELSRAYAAGQRHLHADHVIPVQERPELRLVLNNLQTRCNACHSRKTAREDGGFGHRRASAERNETARIPAGNRTKAAQCGHVSRSLQTSAMSAR